MTFPNFCGESQCNLNTEEILLNYTHKKEEEKEI